MFKLQKAYSYISDASLNQVITETGQFSEHFDQNISLDATLIHTVELFGSCKYPMLLARFIVAELAARIKRTPFQETSYTEIPNCQSSLVTGELTLSVQYHDELNDCPIFSSPTAFLDKVNEIAAEIKPFLYDEKLAKEIKEVFSEWSSQASKSFEVNRGITIEEATAGVTPQEVNKYCKDTFFKGIDIFKSFEAYHKLASIILINTKPSFIYSSTVLFETK